MCEWVDKMYTLYTFETLKVLLCVQSTDVFDRLNGEKKGRSDGTEQQNIQKILDIPQSNKKCEILQEKVCTNERLH